MFCFNKLSFSFGSLRKKENKKAVVFLLHQPSLPITKLLPCAVRSQTFLYVVSHVKILPEVFFFLK